MARRATDADNDDEWDDGDAEWGEDEDDGDEPSTIPCPYCRSEIHEDSPRCPRCERYLSREDVPPARKPWWLIAGVIAGLACVYFWVVG